ncbi:MAG: imidazole glycerol phosphate synthase subunit HisH [Sterolibacterium sp.]|jgi:glutamine amidotransferase
MISPEVAVIDYGMGNLLSVRRGLEHCGATVTVTADHDAILSAPRVVLPGVGAFGDGMAGLCRQGLDAVVREIAARGIPLLGICLGMQMLLDESEEFGATKGLGLIPGRVIPVPSTTIDGHPQKIPHIGWNALVLPKGRESWVDTLLHAIKPGEEVYFVHSFMAFPVDPGHRVADCLYGGMPVSAAIGRKNVFGCQFHPEKSGEVGLKVLTNFLTQ